MALRVIMFLIINAAVLLTFFISTTILGMFGIDIAMYATGSEGNTSLLLFAAIFGFGGAFVSLFLSKFLTKKLMKVQVINPENASQQELWLYHFIEKLSYEAHIKMPEVGIYHGSPNAFATGWSKNSSLIAVSDGLLELMNKEEVEGVLAHEMAHVVNGDMVTMTLLQGVLNTFVIFFARIVGNIIDTVVFKNESSEKGIGYYAIVFVLEIIFSILASIITAYFSRYREFKADEGAVQFHGKDGIYKALLKLGQLKTQPLPNDMKAFGIVGFMGVFSTHPSIEKRLSHIESL